VIVHNIFCKDQYWCCDIGVKYLASRTNQSLSHISSRDDNTLEKEDSNGNRQKDRSTCADIILMQLV
jgi:hypothetical protein